MKRFYKDVSCTQVSRGWQVALDGRGIKTVKGDPQIVASEQLAKALADEWSGQGETLDPAAFQARDLVDYALDIIAPAPADTVEKVLSFGDTDTLLYRADPDEPLYARQAEIWDPIVEAFEAREGVKLVRISGIIHRPQDAAALDILRDRLAALPPIALAGLEAMTSLAASLVTGLSALESTGKEEALALWQAASLEEEWQAQLWGRDDEAEERREKREADFLKTWELTRLALA